MNDTIQHLINRSSVRSFDARPLLPEHEQAILTAALRAPLLAT